MSNQTNSKRSANARVLFPNDYLICHEYINYNYKYELYYIRQSKQRSFRSRKKQFLKFTQFLLWQICFVFFLTLISLKDRPEKKKPHIIRKWGDIIIAIRFIKCVFLLCDIDWLCMT